MFVHAHDLLGPVFPRLVTRSEGNPQQDSPNSFAENFQLSDAPRAEHHRVPISIIRRIVPIEPEPVNCIRPSFKWTIKIG
jgi:hypothetical protein